MYHCSVGAQTCMRWSLVQVGVQVGVQIGVQVGIQGRQGVVGWQITRANITNRAEHQVEGEKKRKKIALVVIICFFLIMSFAETGLNLNGLGKGFSLGRFC